MRFKYLFFIEKEEIVDMSFWKNFVVKRNKMKGRFLNFSQRERKWKRPKSFLSLAELFSFCSDWRKFMSSEKWIFTVVCGDKDFVNWRVLLSCWLFWESWLWSWAHCFNKYQSVSAYPMMNYTFRNLSWSLWVQSMSLCFHWAGSF